VTRQTFGQQLRRHRDKRRISLQTVAAETKVSAGFYKALENGECDRWPGGIYSRGFVRAYATAIGLDPEETVTRFAECYPEFAPVPVPDPAADPAPPAQTMLEKLKAVVLEFARSRRETSA
jgi:cytoskeletal protein RodZ